MAKNNDILFSVLTPCYNSEKYIQRYLNSILSQTYTNIELIIINDGSTDETEAIVFANEKELADKGIKLVYLKKENGGLGSAINYGLKSVSGDYFTWFDSDDFYDKDYFKFHNEYLNENKDCNILKGDGFRITEEEIEDIGTRNDFPRMSDWNTNIYDRKLFINSILEKNHQFPHTMLKTDAFDETVSSRDIYESRAGQNWQLTLPMFYNFDCFFMSKPLFYYVYRKESVGNSAFYKAGGAVYNLYDEHANILKNVLGNMSLKDAELEYLYRLIEQKYIIQKLEYAKSINNQIEIDIFEKQYVQEVMPDNIYSKEIQNILNKKPLVSIIIPVYNGANYLKEAIDSALAQTYPNCEIIVVNDGSSDNGETEKIAQSYGDKIRYFSKENGGVSTALNLGIKNMRGDYFSWLSHDDLYHPEKIEKQINYLIDNNLMNKNVILYSNCNVTNELGEITRGTQFELIEPFRHHEYALLHGLVAGITMLIPKVAFKEYGLFDENYRCVQDYLLFFEMMKNYKFVFMTDRLASSRNHSKQVTKINPRIVPENNYLWIKMQKDIPLKRKIEIAGSEYNFYMDMYNYLKKYFNYTKAENYALEQAKKAKDAPVNTQEQTLQPKIQNETENLTVCKHSKWIRLKDSFKNIGIIGTLRKIKRKAKKKIKTNKVTRPFYVVLKLFLKVVFYMPKKILLLIINS